MSRSSGPASGWSRFVAGFRYAFRGIGHMLVSQRNAQVEAAIAVGVAMAGWYFRISSAEWAAILAVMGLVLGLEAMNTAVEAAVDLVTDEHHELARIAKDSAAGAVLLAALASVAVGIAVFGPRVWALLRQ